MKYFPVPEEKRYKKFVRRYTNEYTFDRRSEKVVARFMYCTLHSARKHAVDACDIYSCTRVRIFDHKIGQYVTTYVREGKSIRRIDGAGE